MATDTRYQSEEAGGIAVHIERQKLQQPGAKDGLTAAEVDLLHQRAQEKFGRPLSKMEFDELMISTKKTLPDAKDTAPDLKKTAPDVKKTAPDLEENAVDPEETASVKTQMSRMQSVIRQLVVDENPKELDDYLSKYNCKPPPLFIIVISVVELIVFIVYAVELKGSKNPVTANSGVPLYSPFIYNPRRRYEAWRFLTYMFIHQGYVHLIFNLVFQLVIGVPLETVHKWWRVALVYLLGVIAGSTAHSVVDPNAYLAGASGGCYALIGAHIAAIINNWREMTKDCRSSAIKAFTSGPTRVAVLVVFVCVDTGVSIYNRHVLGKIDIGYAAHFGGALVGLLIGISVLQNFQVLPWEKIVFWVAVTVYAVCMIFVVCWNAFHPGYPSTDWTPCCSLPP